MQKQNFTALTNLEQACPVPEMVHQGLISNQTSWPAFADQCCRCRMLCYKEVCLACGCCFRMVPVKVSSPMTHIKVCEAFSGDWQPASARWA